MIRWALRKNPDQSYQGTITIVPDRSIRKRGRGKLRKGAPIKLTATSKSKAGALAKASSVANALVSNPIVAAALPPGSDKAVKAIDYLANSAAAGKLESAAKAVIGPGAKRLKSALSSFF